jgi:hypothetical protein
MYITKFYKKQPLLKDTKKLNYIKFVFELKPGGHCDRDHMVVGFTNTYAISAYHH